MARTLLTVKQWSSYSVLLDVTEPDNVTPIDFAGGGYEVLGQVRGQYEDTEPVATFAVEPTATPGQVECTLTAEDTGKLVLWHPERPTYLADFVLRRTSDDWRERIGDGSDVKVLPGVTR